MIKEAIDRIIALATREIRTQEINGQIFSSGELQMVKKYADPNPGEVVVHTLGGFVDLINAGIEKIDPQNILALVASYKQVYLVSRNSNIEGVRTLFINCSLDAPEFRFGEFMEQERFIITLKTFFTSASDRDAIVAIAGKLSHEKVLTGNDDGFTQTVSLRKGVVLTGKPEDLKSVVTLAPFRTFREIEQPASEFIFRIRQKAEGQIPECAIFEADGGKWKLEAVASIKNYLADKITAFPIIA